MGEINICNAAGRDAVVNTESVRTIRKVRWLDRQGRQVSTARILKAPIDRDLDALREQLGGLAKVGQALIDGDVEVDVERVGSFLRDTSRVYVDEHRQTVHKVRYFEVVKNPDGSVRERRVRKLPPPNLAAELPLRWSGRMIDKGEACRKYVFVAKMQVTHINGLTYDFLYGMAKELEEKNSLMLLGAGSKSREPLILRRGGSPYRGFLEGRTRGEQYCLILHLSNLELKAPETPGSASTANSAADR
jgi:hypothetical protein